MSNFGTRRDYHRTGVKKDIKRFISEKQQGTGIDPKGTFIEFLKNDIKKNIDVHRDTVKRVEDLDSRRDLVAVGCTKKFRSLTSEPRNPVKYTLETDHISFRSTEGASLQQAGNSIMANTSMTKADITEKGWAPTVHKVSMRNCQSTRYNIINFEENPNAVVRKAINIDARREKGITEFSDLTRPYNPKFNPDYSRIVTEDPRIFYRKTGIFTHVYDAAARLGNITMPFDKPQDFGGKPAFKC